MRVRVRALFVIPLGALILAFVSVWASRQQAGTPFRPGSAAARAKPASTFTVTNTNDSGAGSLRQAILDANANLGSDLITFIIGSGPQTIAPASLLPDITDPVEIDATTQPGFAGVPIIELSGTNTNSLPNAGLLQVKSGNTTIRGLVINHFKDVGISLLTAGGNHIEGNYIGTDAAGNSKATNSFGNLIAINVPNNVIGGTTPDKRNVLSGGGGHAISIFGDSATGNLIQGNYIGINAAGNKGIGNTLAGIFLGTSNNIVGGTVPGARNVISANPYGGIVMQVSGTFGNVIQGNYIGTDATGSFSIPNDNAGIALFDRTNNNLIGGMTPGARNVISGNGLGIAFNSSSTGPMGNIIQGNYIGLSADGKPLGNRVAGIGLGVATNTTIGGQVPEAANTIAFNGATAAVGVGTGVYVLSATGNSIRGNSIFSNGRLGVDLGNDDVTANDNGDADTGPNNRQNFPIITSVVGGTGQTTINGTLNSAANSTFQIDFYANSGCDPSGNGEGAIPFGSGSVNTDASGNGAFSVVVNSALPTGKAITATATDSAGNTSEFSACDATSAAGSVQFSQASVKVIEDVGFLRLTVVRSGGSVGTLSVDYATTDISATAGQDYVAAFGTLIFNDGETSKTIDVPITNDAITEPDETFVASLSNAPAIDSIGSIGSEVVTIQDASVQPQLLINSVSVDEGDTGTKDAVFTVSLSALTGHDVSVNYSATGNNATRDLDFQATSGNLTFAPRVATRTITVPIIGDLMDEVDEIFIVSLTSPTGASVGSGVGVGTIIDNDPVPSVTVSDISVAEGSGSGLTPARFTFTLSAPSGKSPCVQLSTTNGTATSGSDYQALTPPTFATFDVGASSATFAVSVIQDATVEPDETFFLNVLPCNSNIVVSRSQAVATILNDDPPATMQFSPATYSVDEGAQDAVLTVTRTGNLSLPSTVIYSTGDNSGPNSCNAAATGTASSRCDYLSLIGTLNFAANESSRTVTVPLIDDSYSEGDENFFVMLSSPTGGLLGSTSVATVTIKDNDSLTGANPIDQARFMVRQHYLDFLSRDPDQSGWDFWTNQITACGNDVQCNEVRRIDVSASFFLSIEFQQSGYLVERFYKVAYGDVAGTSTLGSNHLLQVPIIRFLEFLRDTQRIGRGVIVLQPGWEQVLENNKQEYALEFVQSSKFNGTYPTNLTPTQLVDSLNQRAGNVLSPSERTAAINRFGGASNINNLTARAGALRQIAEDVDLYNAEYNRAFVLAEYFGYLRRNPNDQPDSDYTGYDFWLSKLNQFNGNYINAEMVKAFLSSIEYRQRFGP
jgi:hypothetical protein